MRLRGTPEPEQFAGFIKKELVKWAEVVKRPGAKVDSCALARKQKSRLFRRSFMERKYTSLGGNPRTNMWRPIALDAGSMERLVFVIVSDALKIPGYPDGSVMSLAPNPAIVFVNNLLEGGPGTR